MRRCNHSSNLPVVILRLAAKQVGPGLVAAIQQILGVPAKDHAQHINGHPAVGNLRDSVGADTANIIAGADSPLKDGKAQPATAQIAARLVQAAASKQLLASGDDLGGDFAAVNLDDMVEEGQRKRKKRKQPLSQPEPVSKLLGFAAPKQKSHKVIAF